MSTRVTRDREFQVPVEALYAAITDFDNYKLFLPEVVTSEVVAGRGTDTVRVRFEIEVVKRFSYELEFQLKTNKTVSWRLVSGEFFKKNEGQWVLNGATSKTQVRYELEVAVGFLVPGWVAKKLTESGLPQMFERFETRAKEKMKHD